MRSRGTRAALAGPGLIGLALLLAAPVADAAPERGEPRTVSVRTDCVPGGVVLLQQVAGPDSTHVTIDGRHLSDGRWRGEYLLEVGADDTHDVQLDLQATDGAFHHELDVPGIGQAAILDLRRGRGRGCFASYDEGPPYTIAGGSRVDALVRHPGPRRLVARAGLDCGEATRWRAELTVELTDRVLRLRSAPTRCRDGRAEFRWERDLAEPGNPAAPVAVDLLLHGPHGQTRSVSYGATTPAGPAAGLAAITRAGEPPGAGDRVVDVRADCRDGRGTVSMHEVRHLAGTTSVDVAAHGVRNGRWRGTFYRDLDGPSGGSEATALRATAVDHRLTLSFETGAVRSHSTVVLAHRRAPGATCTAYVEDRRRLTLFGGDELDAAGRHNEPGEVRARGYVGGCRDGSHWRTDLTARFGPGNVVGWGARGFTCQDHGVIVRAGTVRTDDAEYPTRVTFVARGSDGDVRRVGYHVEQY